MSQTGQQIRYNVINLFYFDIKTGAEIIRKYD